MRRVMALMVGMLVLGSASIVGAQDFAEIRLGANFLPDPAVATGAAGGPVDASQFGRTPHGACVGSIDTSPDHRLTLEADFSYLRIRAFSDEDTTLVIRTPDGSYLCNDDAVGLDPQIEGAFRAGEYHIYVGTYGGGFPRYRLEISEFPDRSAQAAPTPTPTPTPTPSLGSGGSNFDDVTLSANFLPDPAVVTGAAGGDVNAYDLGRTSHGPCAGRISNNPDHRVTLRANFSYLRFRAYSDADTSLVIRGPDGTLYCNDDAVGLDPQIEGAFSAGVYEVYLGAVGGTGFPDYRLEITEFRP